MSYDAFVAYCAVKAVVSKRMGLLFCYVGKYKLLTEATGSFVIFIQLVDQIGIIFRLYFSLSLSL